jgi:hypothetical protein
MQNNSTHAIAVVALHQYIDPEMRFESSLNIKKGPTEKE